MLGPTGSADGSEFPSDPTAALERLLRSHHARLLAYLRRQVPQSLQSLVDPHDVLQDVYLAAFRRLSEYPMKDGQPLAFAWLLTVARNTLINLIEHHTAQKRGGGRGGGAEDDQRIVLMLEELSVYERTPSRSALEHEAAAALERAIERLPDDYRRAIRLRYIQQLPLAEVAAALGRTLRATEMVCHRAIGLLRDDLAGQ
jgi:RNA polymerase sigma-70 factor (ECF subfamily)